MNRHEIIGRLGADPELRHTAGGKAVCTVSVATDEVWTDRDGQRQKSTEWHKVVLWEKTAENAAKYLSKGSLVLFAGPSRTRSWEKDGTKHYAVEIQGREMKFLDFRPAGEGDGGQRPAPRGPVSGRPDQAAAQPFPIDRDDDIPF